MKKINTLIVLLSALFTLTTQARSILPMETRSAEMTEWTLGGNIPVNSHRVAQILVEVDDLRKLARLVITYDFFCPPNAFCIQAMPAPYIVELPIVEVASHVCGAEVIVAEKDDTPVDGPRQTLTIVNNISAHCDEETFPTEVTYESYYGWTNTTVQSEFAGGPLSVNLDIDLPLVPVKPSAFDQQ